MSSSAASDASPSGKITLDVISVNGSGCPLGGATVVMQPDNTGFRITYKDFVARDGGSAAPTDFRQNCQVNVQLHVPQGFTYAVSSADYRGRASLGFAATALERTNYYFQGSPENNVADHVFAGPLHGAWHTTDVTDSSDLVFAPCGIYRNLNINTELRVNSPYGSSWMSLKSSDGDVDTIVNFSWKHCS
jgi:hypothetical protein